MKVDRILLVILSKFLQTFTKNYENLKIQRIIFRFMSPAKHYLWYAVPCSLFVYTQGIVMVYALSHVYYLSTTGYCDGVNHFPAKCINCTLSMGPACEYPCVHGKEDPPDSVTCACDPCYSDAGCQTECSNHGLCNASSQACGCEAGYKGTLCDQLDCPGT